jgi:hypothetical protein
MIGCNLRTLDQETAALLAKRAKILYAWLSPE